MRPLVITLDSASPLGALTLELPGNVTLQALLPELARVIQLPLAGTDGRPIIYHVIHPVEHRILHPQETLADAGVVTGNTIVLVSGPLHHVKDPTENTDAAAPPSSQHEIRLSPIPEHPPPIRASRGIARPDDKPTTHDRRQEPRRAIAFWSGPAGGTGRTTLALAFAMWSAEHGTDTALLALSEPALSARLHLPRVPNVADFFESGNLARAEQGTVWTRDGREHTLQVILGPSRSWGGPLDRQRIGGLVNAAAASHELVVLDLPSLTPDGSPWALESLSRAGDVILVAAPTDAGLAAVLDALAAMRIISTGLDEAGLGITTRSHLVLNRRAPGGLRPETFVDGIRHYLGACPRLAADIGFLAHLTDERGQENLTTQEQLRPFVEQMSAAVGGVARAPFKP